MDLLGSVFTMILWVVFLGFTVVFPLLPSHPDQWHMPRVYLYEFAWIVLVSVWIVSKRNEGRKTNLDAATLLFLLCLSFSLYLSLLRDNYLTSSIFLLKLQDRWNLLALWNQQDHFFPLRAFLNFVEGALVFWITSRLLTPVSRVRRLFQILVWTAAVVSFLGIVQRFLSYRLLDYWLLENPYLKRVNSTLDDPNVLGAYLACILPILFYSHPLYRNRVHIWTCGGLITLCLIFTASRSAWAAVFGAILILPVLMRFSGVPVSLHLKQRKKQIRYLAFACVFFLAVALPAAWVLNYRDHQPRSLIELVLFTLNPQVSPDDILKGRAGLWDSAWDAFKDHPGFGGGPGSFPRLLSQYNPPGSLLPAYENPHNYLLQLLAETGLAGTIAFAGLLLIAFHSAIRFLKRTVDPEIARPLYASLSAILVLMITSLTGQPLATLKVQYLFWLLLGILFACMPPRKQIVRANAFAAVVLCLLMPLFLFHVRAVLKTRTIGDYEYGYYSRETDETGRPFRWTADRALSVLIPQGKTMRIPLRQFVPDPEKSASSVDILVNDHRLERVSIQGTNWNEFTYFLPDLEEPALLEIRPERTFIPSKLGINADPRQLGVAVGSLTWEIMLPQEFVGATRGQDESFWIGERASFSLQKRGDRLVIPIRVTQAPGHWSFVWTEELVGISQTMIFAETGDQQVRLLLPRGDASRGVLTLWQRSKGAVTLTRIGPFVWENDSHATR